MAAAAAATNTPFQERKIVTPPPEASLGVSLGLLEPEDYSRGYLQLLGQLTTVGDPMTQEQFALRVSLMKQRGVTTYVLRMLVDSDGSEELRVVGTASLLVEPKLIHSCGFVAHIEDVVVDTERVRGKGLGKVLVERLVEEAAAQKCYKVILDTSEATAPFYEKCGFRRREIQMRLDL